jgi:hypothetical protein
VVGVVGMHTGARRARSRSIRDRSERSGRIRRTEAHAGSRLGGVSARSSGTQCDVPPAWIWPLPAARAGRACKTSVLGVASGAIWRRGSSDGDRARRARSEITSAPLTDIGLLTTCVWEGGCEGGETRRQMAPLATRSGTTLRRADQARLLVARGSPQTTSSISLEQAPGSVCRRYCRAASRVKGAR